MRDNGAAVGPHPSLRRTLLTGLIFPLIVLVPVAAALLYGLAVRPALDGLDRALTDTAVALSNILETRAGQVSLPLSEQTLRALQADLVDEVNFAVGNERGELLNGDAALLALKPPLAAGQWRFFDTTLRAKRLRVAALGAACGAPPQVCPILVSESLGKRLAAERAVAIAALVVTVGLAAALSILAMVSVRRGLRPLRIASAEMHARSLQRLDPLSVASVPREAVSFVLALNELFARLRTAASAQRAFVEDAAHQLRTPLSTLLVESSLALARPHAPELQVTLERLHAAAQRGARVAQQLLTLARADGTALGDETARSRVDLAALAAGAANDWLHRALAAGQDLGFDLQPAAVHGNAHLLGDMLGNLIDNAIQHAGTGAAVTVRTATRGAHAVLEVEDDGEGMPAEELTRVWDRFHRGSGASAPGTGLGLAIVRSIALLHQGETTLLPGSAGRGVIARITLPLAGG